MNNLNCVQNGDCPQIRDVFSLMQDIFDEQQKQIAKLQNEVVSLNEKLHQVQQQIQSLKHHLDNGWKADLVKKILEQNMEYMNKIIDTKLKLVEETQRCQIDQQKLKQDRKIIDINKLVLALFASGGLLYMIMDIIQKLLSK